MSRDRMEALLEVHRQQLEGGLGSVARGGEGVLPARVELTEESAENVRRAPVGTGFFCVTEPGGRTHCAASAALGEGERSRLGGQEVGAVHPGWAGTGHQQVARLAGVRFAEETARQGFVEGEGYGSSLWKGEEGRRYGFRSAFNSKVSADGDRELPEVLARRFEAGMEASLRGRGERP